MSRVFPKADYLAWNNAVANTELAYERWAAQRAKRSARDWVERGERHEKIIDSQTLKFFGPRSRVPFKKLWGSPTPEAVAKMGVLAGYGGTTSYALASLRPPPEELPYYRTPLPRAVPTTGGARARANGASGKSVSKPAAYSEEEEEEDSEESSEAEDSWASPEIPTDEDEVVYWDWRDRNNGTAHVGNSKPAVDAEPTHNTEKLPDGFFEQSGGGKRARYDPRAPEPVSDDDL